jgi:NTP pyrophosphatase (non-canonical NTP hydrolase)
MHMQYQAMVRRLFVKPQDKTGRLVHAAMGISGEAGEIVDAVKKHSIYGKPLDTENVLEECGDVLFYLVAMLQECGYTLMDAMEHNQNKLAKRYPNGWNEQDAIERKDKA